MRHDPETMKRLARDIDRLGVQEACRRHGVHRSTWYRWVARGPTEPDPRVGQLERAVLEICAERPAWGCDRIAYYLGVSGLQASSPTIQRILVRHGLGRKADRIAWSEGSSGARSEEG